MFRCHHNLQPSFSFCSYHGLGLKLTDYSSFPCGTNSPLAAVLLGWRHATKPCARWLADWHVLFWCNFQSHPRPTACCYSLAGLFLRALPWCSVPFSWDCKWSGLFLCVFISASRPTRPLLLCFLVIFLSALAEPNCSIRLFHCCCVSGSFFPSRLSSLGSWVPHLISVKVLGSPPWLFVLWFLGLLLSVFPHAFALSAHIHFLVWVSWTTAITTHCLLPLPF